MDMQKEREKVLYAVGELFDLVKEKQAEIDDLKQKLSKASAVPDGYVVVPKEPTDEIIAAMDGWDLYDFDLIIDCYKAMIEAAQE